MVYRYSKPPTQRQLRVASIIKQEIAAILIGGALPHLEILAVRVTVTEVRVSADLKLATIFIIAMPAEYEKPTVDYLADNVGMIRREISHALRMRAVPMIRFVYDKAFHQVTEVNALLSGLTK
jgi:ribosome-binding factor A